MNYRMVKVLLGIMFVLTVLFFSNDFGLIDIERTAIITAIAIDYDKEGEYEVTVQIAVPEATDTNSESKRAQITGKSGTVGAALKKIGNVSGWYPNMNFCNLLVISREFANSNIIKALDYFSKTLRIQDSALVVMADGKAKDILSATTPLDNISSFALQKIIIKNNGFENNIVSMDIKTFCVGYYSSNASSFMPVVKIVKGTSESNSSAQADGQESIDGENGSGGNTENETDGKVLFSADTTALFYKGIKVGELDSDMSFVFNNLKGKMSGATFEVVADAQKKDNYLLTILKNDAKINIIADESQFKTQINLSIYCKISDRNAERDEKDFAENMPLPDNVKKKAENYIKQNLTELLETEKQTGCDFLNLKQKLYRKHYKEYTRYKDNFLSVMTYEVNVNVSAQK